MGSLVHNACVWAGRVHLWNYHLMNIRTPELEQHIQEGLQEKYNSIKRRIDYQKKKVTHENNNTDT